MPIVLLGSWPFFCVVCNPSPTLAHICGHWISLDNDTAFIYCLVATVSPQIFPVAFMSMGRVAVYFVAAATIISLTLPGQMLELKARTNTSAAIKSLLGLAPKQHVVLNLMVLRKRCRIPTCLWATCCVCSTVKRCLWMEWSLKAKAQ